jgi:putative transposase
MAFVTTTVKDWTPVFSDSACAQVVLRQLEETSHYFDASIAAYVIMPSHVHALLGLREIERLSQLMQSFKSLSARRILPHLTPELRGLFGESPLWKPRYDDLIIWSEKQFKVKVEYIHNNPVKAGLAGDASDYVFSSAQDWLTDNPGPLRIDKEWTWQAQD